MKESEARKRSLAIRRASVSGLKDSSVLEGQNPTPEQIEAAARQRWENKERCLPTDLRQPFPGMEALSRGEGDLETAHHAPSEVMQGLGLGATITVGQGTAHRPLAGMISVPPGVPGVLEVGCIPAAAESELWEWSGRPRSYPDSHKASMP